MHRSWLVGLSLMAAGCLLGGSAGLLFGQARQVRREAAELLAGARLVRELTAGTDLQAGLTRRSADSAWLSSVEEASGRAPQLLQEPLHELFRAVGVEVLSSTPWESERDTANPTRVVFSKTYELFGEIGPLCDALYSLESWPDRLRVTRISLLPDSKGRVQCKWELTTVRGDPGAGGPS